ncbi:hypothetical protein OG21DRAFT_1513060 [Imleria badia]|nr:hypothetical protein OG21DRAFT_1513060 [Imleria badia]
MLTNPKALHAQRYHVARDTGTADQLTVLHPYSAYATETLNVSHSHNLRHPTDHRTRPTSAVNDAGVLCTHDR